MDKLSYIAGVSWMRLLQVELRLDGFRVNSVLASGQADYKEREKGYF